MTPAGRDCLRGDCTHTPLPVSYAILAPAGLPLYFRGTNLLFTSDQVKTDSFEGVAMDTHITLFVSYIVCLYDVSLRGRLRL